MSMSFHTMQTRQQDPWPSSLLSKLWRWYIQAGDTFCIPTSTQTLGDTLIIGMAWE